MNEDLHVAYRPEIFDEVIGQDHIIDSLKHIQEKNVWPHAYLLVGPSGCGKTTVGRIIANELGCEPSSLVEIDAASHSSVDGVRQLSASLQYTGFGETPTRVIIIDECHSLSKQAWQALLKPIEEPPAHIYFILCTTEEDKVPETIKTRCSQYNFRSVPSDILAELVDVIAELEEIPITEKMATLIAQEADGSPRKALTLLSKARGVENIEDLKDILESASDNKSIIELCRLLLKTPNWKRAIRLINDMEELPPETIRLTIVSYMSKVLLNTTDERKAIKVLTVLESFSEPFNSSEKKAPLLLAVGNLCFGADDE